MKLQKVAKEDIYEALKSTDGMVMEMFGYKGIYAGDELPEINGTVIVVFGHPESDCYWCVVQVGETYYEVPL